MSCPSDLSVVKGSLLKILSSQLWELSRECAITNERTVKGKVWGFQLTVRAPMRVSNKMNSEARVTMPWFSASAYSSEKISFTNLKEG